MEKADAIIIGAGVIGCATGFELAKRGYKVIIVDKLGEPGTGSTAGSCAIVRAHYSTYAGVAMAYEGFFYWLNWPKYLETTDEQGLANYMNCGSILLKTKGHKWRTVLEHYKKAGVKHEEWTLEQLQEKMPLYSHSSYYPTTRPEDDPKFYEREPAGEIEGAVFTPESGYVDDPQLATHNLLRAAEAKGAKFIGGHAITEIHRDGDQVTGVTLDDGRKLEAPIVVNVAGPHSYIINRMAGVEDTMNIKTKALRHEVVHVPSPAGFDFEHKGFHTSDADCGIYFRPASGNAILLGSEDPECDPKDWVDDPDNYNRELTDAQWEAQVARLARRMPNLEMPREKTGFADLYDCSDDWIPIYDKSDLKGFYMAVGTSGNQFKTAPIVGHCMAELIDACEKKGHDHDKNPLVVKGPYTGLELPLGPFSRTREINPNSSFSVNG